MAILDQDTRRRRILEAMSASLNPPQGKQSSPEPRRGTPMSRAAGIDGWGERGDQENPLIGLGRRIAGDARETVSDIKDEPAEVPYRLRERARSYFPQWKYREGDYTNEPLGAASQGAPSKPIVNLPPANVNIPTDVPPPMPTGTVSEGTPNPDIGPPPPRVGYSLSGLTGVDRLLERRKAMESADPESNIRETGDFIKVEDKKPRKGFLGHLKALGEGALVGLASGDPDNPNNILGSAIGGGTLGAVSPRGEKKLLRKFEMSALDNDIARGLKLEQEGAGGRGRGPMGSMSTRVVGEGEYEGMDAGTEIRVRLNPRTGEVVDVVGPDQKPVVSKSAKTAAGRAPHYESDSDGYLISVESGVAKRVKDPSGNDVKVKAKNSDGEVVEVEVNGKTLKVTPGQALSYYGQIGERETKRNEAAAENKGKRAAKLKEAKDLVHHAEIYDNNAAEYEKDIPNTPKEELPALQAKINSFREQAQQARTAAAKARSEGESIPEASASKTLDPELEKKIRAAASAKGLNPDIAVERARARQ